MELFMEQGSSQSQASEQAPRLIGRTIQKQAALLFSIDVFHVLAILAISMVPLALLRKQVKRGEAHTGRQKESGACAPLSFRSGGA
jgi:hypothetical protein